MAEELTTPSGLTTRQIIDLAEAMCPDWHRTNWHSHIIKKDGTYEHKSGTPRPCVLHLSMANRIAPVVAEMLRQAAGG